MLKTLNLIAVGLCISTVVMNYQMGDTSGILIFSALGSLNLYLGVSK